MNYELRIMIANLSNPIAAIRGALSLGSHYYARMLNGQCIIQRKPDRSNHIPSSAQLAAQQSFGTKFGTERKKHPSSSFPSPYPFPSPSHSLFPSPSPSNAPPTTLS